MYIRTLQDSVRNLQDILWIVKKDDTLPKQLIDKFSTQVAYISFTAGQLIDHAHLSNRKSSKSKDSGNRQ